MTRSAVLAALVVAALLFGACSSGGGGKSPSDTDVTGATASPQKLGGTGPLADVRVYSGLTRNHVEVFQPLWKLLPLSGSDLFEFFLQLGL